MSMSFLEFEAASNELFERYKPLYANCEDRKELYFKYCKEFHALRDQAIYVDGQSKAERTQIDQHSDKLNNKAMKLAQK